MSVQVCPVTDIVCTRGCEQICRNECNSKVAPIRDERMLQKALRDFSNLPHVEHDHWTEDCIASMVSQAEAQIDLVQENEDPDFVREPGDIKKLRAFVRKWKAHSAWTCWRCGGINAANLGTCGNCKGPRSSSDQSPSQESRS